jgi:hypothetical protein
VASSEPFTDLSQRSGAVNEEDERIVQRILARWKRGLHFRVDPSFLIYLLKYTGSVDLEGVS